MSGPGAAGSAILDPIWATALLSARRAGVPSALRHAATEHRLRGDWRAACAAAAVAPRIDVAEVRRRHGPDITRQMLDDLRHFAPDLLRWHLPRSLPGGGPQKDLVLSLAQYRDGSTLALSTPGSHWAAGERVVLDLLDRPPMGRRAAQWRLVHHRHLWDAHESRWPEMISTEITQAQDAGEFAEAWRMAGVHLRYPAGDRDLLRRLPVDLPRLMDEKRRLQGDSSVVVFRLGGGRAIVLAPGSQIGSYASGVDAYVIKSDEAAGLPVLPRPAWCRSFDDEVLRLGLASPDELHPLICGIPRKEALPDGVEIRCQGTLHRIRREQGRWIAPDHDARQADAEQFLARIGGPPSGCYQALADLTRSQAALKARFETHERYRSALTGTTDLPTPTRKPRPPEPFGGRGRRNAKPLTGAYIPTRHQRKGVSAETEDYPWGIL